MTIRGLLSRLSTLDQLLILQRADWLGLPTGRYYAGELSEEQVAMLTQGIGDGPKTDRE